MDFAKEVLDAIEIMVKQVVEDNTTKIYTGICKSANSDGTCELDINGKINTVKYYGEIPLTGNVYRVFLPFGNMSAAFIIVPSGDSGGGSGGGAVNSVNGKVGNVVLTANDLSAVPISGATMTGALIAQNNTNYTTPQMRNIIISPNSPSNSDGQNGDIWIQYKEN